MKSPGSLVRHRRTQRSGSFFASGIDLCMSSVAAAPPTAPAANLMSMLRMSVCTYLGQGKSAPSRAFFAGR